MTSIGARASKSTAGAAGAPSSYTEAGPPERMIALGRLASISATGMVDGTISLKTRHSRTRRAINCAYCAPKSTTRTVSKDCSTDTRETPFEENGAVSPQFRAHGLRELPLPAFCGLEPHTSPMQHLVGSIQPRPPRHEEFDEARPTVRDDRPPRRLPTPRSR